VRKCGDCQLCCKLMPVADFQLIKKAGVRCQYQKHGVGCKLHGRRNMPASCRIWNCRWLANTDTHDLPRPDRAHYVIDPMPDFVTIRDNDTGNEVEIQIIQIWLEPGYFKALDTDSFRTYLNRQGIAALVRLDERRSYVIAPPSMSGRDHWIQTEVGTAPEGTTPHTIRQIAEKLGGQYEHEHHGEGKMSTSTITMPDGSKVAVASTNLEVWEEIDGNAVSVEVERSLGIDPVLELPVPKGRIPVR